MPTEMELTLEQTQQGVSYEVSVFAMKMEILLEPTSNKLIVEHAEYDVSNTYVLERFNTTAGNPVKKILLKLNLSDHRILKDGGGVRSVNVKEFKKDANINAFQVNKSKKVGAYVGPKVHKFTRWPSSLSAIGGKMELCLVDDIKMSRSHNVKYKFKEQAQSRNQ
ncbi:hypothetical protein Tco_1467713 [Tanacetum coccineum]